MELSELSPGFTDWEFQCIKIKSSGQQNSDLIIGNIYRLPKHTNENYETFIKEFSHVFHKLDRPSVNVAVFGDFNIDILKSQEVPNINEFLDNMLSFGLIPKITLPTRFSHDNASLIDNAFCKLTNDFATTTAGILTCNLSDHQPYFITLDYMGVKDQTIKQVQIQRFNAQNIKKIIDNFNSLNISELIDQKTNPNESFTILQDSILELKEKHFPVKVVKFNKYKHRKQKWITKGILNSIKYRDKLYNRLKKCPKDSEMCEILQINLRTYNKILKSSIRQAKSDYYHKTFQKFKSDMKRTWVNIKEIMSRQTERHELPQYFLINNSKISDPHEISHAFNNYFNKLGYNQNSKSKSTSSVTYNDYLTEFAEQQFCFVHVSEHSIEKVIDKLVPKSSEGMDGLSVRFLKLVHKPLLKPLKIIVNQMFSTGIFPDRLKVAKIVPCYKKSDEHKIENYRPISILPSLSKIFEKIMLQQLHEHFTCHNLYFDGQYGFREGHSTEFAIMENIDRIIDNLEAGRLPFNIYVDLSKAFDSLDHDILLQKLSSYGVQNTALELCESYLQKFQQNRYQCYL